MKEFISRSMWFEHRVSYGETDAMQVLYYAEYLHIFERARSFYIRELGMSYSEVEERGIFLPVREAQCRYRSSARYDDLLQICLGITVWGRASMTFGYEIYDEQKTRHIASGMTQHAFVGPDGVPCKVPAWFKDMVEG